MFRCPILRTRVPLSECTECEWADKCQTIRTVPAEDLKDLVGQGTEAFKSVCVRILEGNALPSSASAVLTSVSDDEPEPDQPQPEEPPMSEEEIVEEDTDATPEEDEDPAKARTRAATEARLARYRERKLAGMLIMVETKKGSGLFQLAMEDTPAGELLLARNEGRRVIATFEYHEL